MLISGAWRGGKGEDEGRKGLVDMRVMTNIFTKINDSCIIPYECARGVFTNPSEERGRFVAATFLVEVIWQSSLPIDYQLTISSDNNFAYLRKYSNIQTI